MLWRPTPFLLTLLLALLLAGCYTTTPERLRSPAARPATHYYDFESADALAAYLRYNAETGPLLSAHRGGPASGYPENALPTFERTLRFAPALIECDVRMTRDSTLVLMHDETLERTTTGEGPVEEHMLASLRALRLVDPMGHPTPFRIPTLAEALSWAEGRAVLTLDVKEEVPPERVVEVLQRFDAMGRALVITYTLEDAQRYHRLAPELVLSVTAETVEEAQALFDSGIDASRLIAFTGVGTVKPDLIDLLHAYNVRAMLGTFGEIDERARREGTEVYRALINRGVDVLATDLVPVAARAVLDYEAAAARP